MIGKEPTLEKSETADQKLIRLLKEKGAEDPEVKEFLDSWMREQEMAVERSNDYIFGQIQFNLRRARLYFQAGYVDAALENFEAAGTQAWNLYNNELYQAIMREMDELQ